MFSSDSKFERFGGTIDLNLAARLYGRFGDPIYNDLRECLNCLNYQADRTTHGHLKAAVSNVIAQARCRFVDPMGLRLGPVTSEEPLVNWLVLVSMFCFKRFYRGI
jgi:Glycogen debranching enzyme, glucanotransferase domain